MEEEEEEGSQAPITANRDKMCSRTLTSGAFGSIRNLSNKGIKCCMNAACPKSGARSKHAVDRASLTPGNESGASK